MNVPFADLRAMHQEIRHELREVFERVIDNSTFVLGPEVLHFEREFARYVGTKHCIALNTGTAAVHLALAGLGIGPGDEVITVPHTFIATAEAISAVGALPVFVDIDPVTFTMDPELLEAAITPRTRAIVPVHLYGQVADMDEILAVAARHNLPVVEDACQAHGATYKGRNAGAIGVAGCFSFYPGKNLGACGEGGAVTTDDDDLARSIRLWRDHGSPKRYEHVFPGHNMRMEGIQGGILAVKLKYLDEWNNKRRAAAAAFDAALAGTDIATPTERADRRHVYHLYVVQTDRRDQLKAHLAEAGIETALHYPTPLHLQEAYRSLGYRKGDFPVTERIKDRILSLPMYPHISTDAIAHVATELKESCYVS